MPGVSKHRATRIAGALYLLQMTTGVFGYIVRSRLTVAGDLSATAINITTSETLFRLSIVTDILTYSAVSELCWALYILLESEQKDLARLGLVLRLVENAVLCSWTVGLLLTTSLLRSSVYQSAMPAVELHGLARLFLMAQGQAHTVAFVLLGLGSAAFALALWRSGHLPAWLGGLGVTASLLLAAGSVVVILYPPSSPMVRPISFAPMGIYEVTVGAWLLFRKPSA